MQAITSTIREFLGSNFVLAAAGALGDDQSLMEAGVIDSTGVLELTEFIAERFEIEVADAEIVPENLDTIARIGAFVARKVAAREGGE